ncbi:MAG: YdcF family protein [Planctomycetes bacterium]|nr:YdcF family protein [Planctomycetota bacterium]
MRVPRSKTYRRVILALVLASLVAGLAVALANATVLRLGGSAVRASIAELDDAPVAIVLGAAVKPDGTPSHALEDRLAQAVELYRAGRVKKLLLSGDHGAERYDEPNAMKRYALEHGVRPEDVFCDHAGFSTWDTFVRARDVFGVTRAIVVTQRFHLPRALYSAKANGIEAQGTQCDARTYQKSAWFEVRELGSRAKAWLQAHGVASGARASGAPISIEGDGRVSWDRTD